MTRGALAGSPSRDLTVGGPVIWLLLAGCGSLIEVGTPKDTAASDDTDASADTDVDTTPDDTPEDTADTGSPAGSDSDADARTVVRFHQYVRYWSSYLESGTHEVLVGPADGSAPSGGSWVVVQDAASAQAAALDQQWAETTVDLTQALADNGWTDFRVAFHYRGENADNWYLDDVCVTSTNAFAPEFCDRMWLDFDELGIGELSEGVSVDIGAADRTGDAAWGATSSAGPALSPERSMYISYSSDPVDQYLVLTP